MGAPGTAMNVVIRIPGADALGRNFLTWTPIQATARLVNSQGNAPVAITLRNAGPTGGGRVRFATTRTHLGATTLALNLPITGAPVSFFVAGEFGRPSVALGDAVIQARRTATTTVLGSKRVTVRVRKNAQTLTPAERDRFVAAFGTLNGGGAGRFTDFRDMHVAAATAEAHGNVGFLPWHRAYLLDLERELQAIDASVTLPYWRFDQPAPNLFTREFMGVSNAVGRVEFTAGHPFGTWRTDGALGISRRPLFPTGSAPAGLRTELETLALGGAAPGATYANFDIMEGNPHGSAHVRFDGFISAIPTAARDPLFFLLHANVDRLWAKWQWIHRRTSPAEPRSFAAAVAAAGRAQPRRHDVAVERCHWRTEAADRARRHVPFLADHVRTRPQPDRAGDDRPLGGREWPVARLRLRRRTVRAVAARERRRGSTSPITASGTKPSWPRPRLARLVLGRPPERVRPRGAQPRPRGRGRSKPLRLRRIASTSRSQSCSPPCATSEEPPTVRRAALRALAGARLPRTALRAVPRRLQAGAPRGRDRCRRGAAHERARAARHRQGCLRAGAARPRAEAARATPSCPRRRRSSSLATTTTPR